MSATPPFAALATAPGLARGHVRATLAEWNLGELADIAELIVSEMTANAVNASALVQAAGSMLVIRLCLITSGDVLTIECWDQAPGVPVMRQATGYAETGRGLAVIDSLTGGAWGWQPAIGQAGKCVWAELRVLLQQMQHSAVSDKPPNSLASPIPAKSGTPGPSRDPRDQAAARDLAGPQVSGRFIRAMAIPAG